MNQKTATILKSTFIILAFAFSVEALATWTLPSSAPTGGNTPPPLNTSISMQAKNGGLWLGGLFVNGHADFNSTLSTVGAIGVGVLNPTAKLDVAGKIKMVDGTQGQNKVLASDATGLASWKNLSEIGGGNGGGGNNGSTPGGSGSTNYVSKWTNSNTLANSQIYDNGTNVGVGMSAPTAKLQVAGQVKITGGNPGMNKILASDLTGLASWKTPTEIGIGDNNGGGGGSGGFSTSFNVLSCTLPVSAGTLNTTNGIYGFHFTVPPSMNGWKLSKFIGSACDGDGDITITPQIKKANGTLQSLSSFTVSAWNQPGEWTGSQTVGTGDRIKVGNWTNSGELSGLTISIVLKP